MELIKSPNYNYDKKVTLFEAGPIQGAPQWQIKLANDLSDIKDLLIANPRRENDPNFVYEEQVEWESYYLNRADIIVFYIPKEEVKVEGRVYAQTTNIELAEWLTLASKLINKKLVICIDDSITTKKYLLKKIKQYKNENIIYVDTYEELLSTTRKLTIDIINKEPKTFFTSDTHYSAQRTLDLSKRPFRTVEEMDKAMITNHNDSVKPNDTVYHLGDFGNYETVKYLNGNIHLILGNYERDEIEKGTLTIEKLLEYGFASVSYDKHLKVFNDEGKYHIVHLVHEPEKCDKNFKYNLFGHIHGRQMIKRYGLEVGVDTHNYRPISTSDVSFFLNSLDKGYYDNNVFE